MADSPLVTDYAVTDYLQLTAGGAVGASELGRSGKAFGVVADDSGRPVQLLTADGRAPLVQVEAHTPMGRMVRSDVVALINRGVPAMVVVHNDRCVGILTAEAVSGYAMAHLDVTTGPMGDATAVLGEAPIDIDLPGQPVTKPLMLTCAVCGAVNSVPYFVEGETRCVNGHPLEVAWD
jgi:hypothetical protein